MLIQSTIGSQVIYLSKEPLLSETPSICFLEVKLLAITLDMAEESRNENLNRRFLREFCRHPGSFYKALSPRNCGNNKAKINDVLWNIS